MPNSIGSIPNFLPALCMIPCLAPSTNIICNASFPVAFARLATKGFPVVPAPGSKALIPVFTTAPLRASLVEAPPSLLANAEVPNRIASVNGSIIY